MSSPGSEPTATATSVHPDFNAADADVIFESSDGMQFHVHRKNLEVCTDAFPGSEFDTHDEITHLTETAEILGILFQFVYPRKHPTLRGLGFEVVAAVAEAVEKYQVFPAMTACEVQLRTFISTYPTRIFAHALKHDYRELMDDVAPQLARTPLLEVASEIPNQDLISWIRYESAWKSIFSRARNGVSPDVYGHCHYGGDHCCMHCSFSSLIWINRLEGIASLSSLKDALELEESEVSNYFHCGNCYIQHNKNNHCRHTVSSAGIFKDGIGSIPPFTHFLDGNTWTMTG